MSHSEEEEEKKLLQRVKEVIAKAKASLVEQASEATTTERDRSQNTWPEDLSTRCVDEVSTIVKAHLDNLKRETQPPVATIVPRDPSPPTLTSANDPLTSIHPFSNTSPPVGNTSTTTTSTSITSHTLTKGGVRRSTRRREPPANNIYNVLDAPQHGTRYSRFKQMPLELKKPKLKPRINMYHIAHRLSVKEGTTFIMEYDKKRKMEAKVEDGKYICLLCDKDFKSRYKLKAHGKGLHESEKQFACEICAKRFEFKEELRASLHHLPP